MLDGCDFVARDRLRLSLALCVFAGLKRRDLRNFGDFDARGGKRPRRGF